MRRIDTIFILLFIFLSTAFSTYAAGKSPCINDPITFGGVKKQLLPLPQECPIVGDEGRFCGRGAHKTGQYAPSPACAVPTMIVMHTTQGTLSAEDTYNYFNSGSDGRGVGSHFVIGQNGTIIQMVEMGKSQVEYAQAVGPIDDAISIELGAPGNYSSFNQAPSVQNTSALRLVKALMETYNIPPEKVISHKSIGGPAGDPGDGWMAGFKNELAGMTSGLQTSSGSDGDNTQTSSGSSTSGTGSLEATSNSCTARIGSPTLQPNEEIGCSSAGNGGVGGPGGVCKTDSPLKTDYASAIKQDFGVNFLPGFSQQQLKWVYEQFHAVSSGGFIPLVRDVIIAPTSREDFVSWQEGCPVWSPGGSPSPDVYFNTLLNEIGTKTLIIHELTHVIQKCHPNGISNHTEIRSAYATEGGITHYSRTLCGFSGVDKYNEDHADTIALHLNPKSWPQTCNFLSGGGYREPYNPFDTGRFPQHRTTAERLVGKYACSK